MTPAQEQALIMLADEPDGVFADPEVPVFVALLVSLESEGCASAEKCEDDSIVYRLTLRGQMALHDAHLKYRRLSLKAIGDSHHAAHLGIVGLHIGEYERLKKLSLAFERAFYSIDWRDGKPKRKEIHDVP